MNDIVAVLLGAVASLGVGIFANWFYDLIFADIVRKLLNKPIRQKQTTYRKRINQLVRNLSKASKEVDDVLTEISIVSNEREEAITKLEKQLAELTNREQQTKARIEALEKIPLEAVQHLEGILEKGDKRSAFRDYLLFGLGVIVSTIIAIILKLMGF